jgi:MoxR-like ATPase
MHAIAQLREYINASIIGQPVLVNRLLIALLADGHLLVEGPPGLAKTRSVEILSRGIEAAFQRIQFTPDLLPADLTGSDVFRPQHADFAFQPGPLFHNVILADEINRAPPKVQSALLEAMAERQISIGQKSYALPPLYLVMATQNPIEHEGTYALPEAQLDRFLLHTVVGYPQAADERRILHLSRGEARSGYDKTRAVPDAVVSQSDILAARDAVLDVYMADAVEQYVIELVLATRQPQTYGDDLQRWIAYGGSPRATMALDRCARAHAWLDGRDYAAPADVQTMLADVLRHRLILTFEAETEGVDADHCVATLLDRVTAP